MVNNTNTVSSLLSLNAHFTSTIDEAVVQL